jgi:adenylosuccinate synthase
VCERVVTSLTGSTKIGYVVTDEDDAIDGVRSGEYYAAVVIPKNFSTNLLSVLTKTPEHPQLDYYVNEKRNAIASIVTGKASGSVQTMVNEGFAEAVTEVATELFDEVGEKLGEVGHEYGVTTGRKRRCGWYDGVVVNYAARVNGLTDLAITKLDVLGCLESIKVCVAYECDGVRYTTVPEHQSVFYHAKPVYEELPGWNCDISGVRNFYQLPREAKDYIDFLEQLAGVRVSIITVGPDREQTIDRYWH